LSIGSPILFEKLTKNKQKFKITEIKKRKLADEIFH